jgi:hypothetical protein
MSKELQLREALENAEANIAYLATLPDSTLAEKLDTIHLQTSLAEQKKNTPASELLEMWRSQVIQARIHKAENGIPDAPGEIESAIADIETKIAITEEREQALEELAQPVQPQVPKKQQQQDNQSQLKLF